MKKLGIILLVLGLGGAIFTEVQFLPESPWTRSKLETLALWKEFPANILMGVNAILVGAGLTLSSLKK